MRKNNPLLADPPVQFHSLQGTGDQYYKSVVGRRPTMDDYYGVHTTGDFAIAMAYAQQTADKESEDGAYPVVVSICADGLQPYPDVDAVVNSRELTRSYYNDDVNRAANNFYDYESVWQGDPYYAYIENNTRNSNIAQIFVSLCDDPQEMWDLWGETGSMPDEVAIELTNQKRFKTDIHIDRIVEVKAFKRLHREILEDWWYDEDAKKKAELIESAGYALVSMEDISGGNIPIKSKSIYKQPHKCGSVEYHGTSSVRLKLAFPEMDLPPDPYPIKEIEEIEDNPVYKPNPGVIKLDKHRIRELSKEIELALIDKLKVLSGPLGSRNLIRSFPFDIVSVDGTLVYLLIGVDTVFTNSNEYIVSGGMGFLKSTGQPVVVINLNGNKSAEAMLQAATGRVLQLQLYPMLLHELTHVADKFEPGYFSSVRARAKGNKKIKQSSGIDKTTYYNHPSEVRAYIQNIVEESQLAIQYWDKLEAAYGPSDAMSLLLKKSDTWKEVYPYWTEKNKKLAIRVLSKEINMRKPKDNPIKKDSKIRMYSKYISHGIKKDIIYTGKMLDGRVATIGPYYTSTHKTYAIIVTDQTVVALNMPSILAGQFVSMVDLSSIRRICPNPIGKTMNNSYTDDLDEAIDSVGIRSNPTDADDVDTLCKRYHKEWAELAKEGELMPHSESEVARLIDIYNLDNRAAEYVVNCGKKGYVSITGSSNEQYLVAIERMRDLKNKIEKFERKTKKLKLSNPIRLEVMGEKVEPVFDYDGNPTNEVRVYKIVELHGEVPRVLDFAFIARIEHLSEGENVVNVAPGVDIKLPRSLWTADSTCDHCKRDRYRKETFLLQNVKTKKLVRVGRSCLSDFLRSEDLDAATSIWSMIDLIKKKDKDEGEHYGSYTPYLMMTEFLAATWRVIEKYGWMSKKYAESALVQSTADTVMFVMYPPSSLLSHEERENWKALQPDPRSRAKAHDVLVWASNIKPTSDYEMNLKVLANLEYVPGKSTGFVASMVAAYKRAKGEELIKKDKKEKGLNEWFGTVGNAYVKKLTVMKASQFEGHFGVTTMLIMQDDEGRQFKWFASGGGPMHPRYEYDNPDRYDNMDKDSERDHFKIDVGDSLWFKFSIKKHDSWVPNQGVEQKSTVITRAKVFETMPSLKWYDPTTGQVFKNKKEMVASGHS